MSDTRPDNGPQLWWIFPAGLGGFLAAIAIIKTCVIKIKRSRRSCSTPLEGFFKDLANEKPIRYTAQELDACTTNYSTRLGSGGFGVVYKGKLPNGVDIAVKVLHKSMDSRAEEQQFMAEVGSIGRTSHINLIRLYGFCYDDQTSALVYECLENGPLDKYLFEDTQKIEWEKLYGIAIGTAKGIAHLHEECRQRIIHYDIKPANILLDANFVPKLADFGLAKLCNRDNTHVTMSGYRGTLGYAAPELFFMNCRATHKCDVYSFGMLLFEIIGRRRNFIVGSSTESLNWFPKQVWDEYEKGELAAKIVSCGIEEKDRETTERMATVAFWCVQDSPEGRPPMSAVVKMLEGGVEVVPPPKPFHYLTSAVVNGLNPTIATNTSNSSDQSSSKNGIDLSFWYKETAPILAENEMETAPILAENEIQVVSTN